MDKNGFSIQKFVGVTPAQLAKLHKVLTTEPIRKSGYIESGKYVESFAELKTVTWDHPHESLTIEVVVYDYAMSRRGVNGNKPWCVHDEHAKTERWVVEKILDALERFEGKKRNAA